MTPKTVRESNGQGPDRKSMPVKGSDADVHRRPLAESVGRAAQGRPSPARASPVQSGDQGEARERNQREVHEDRDGVELAEVERHERSRHSPDERRNDDASGQPAHTRRVSTRLRNRVVTETSAFAVRSGNALEVPEFEVETSQIRLRTGGATGCRDQGECPKEGELCSGIEEIAGVDAEHDRAQQERSGGENRPGVAGSWKKPWRVP